MSATPDFIKQQFEFTRHIRDPENNSGPDGIEDRRMAVYREMFFNNVEDFVSSSCPVLRSLYTEADWNVLIRGFFVTHRCHSPLFLDIAKEFVEYLQTEREPQEDDLPFMLELAHYEWVELALLIADDDSDYSNIDANGDLLDSSPVVSPVAWPLSYNYPVHKITEEFQPTEDEAEPTFLVVYRDRTFEIGFLEINPVTARLLELIMDNTEKTLTGREILTLIAQELGHDNPDTIIEAGLGIMQDLQASGVLLGTRKN